MLGRTTKSKAIDLKRNMIKDDLSSIPCDYPAINFWVNGRIAHLSRIQKTEKDHKVKKARQDMIDIYKKLRV
jgi:hypothetical protein